MVVVCVIVVTRNIALTDIRTRRRPRRVVGRKSCRICLTRRLPLNICIDVRSAKTSYSQSAARTRVIDTAPRRTLLVEVGVSGITSPKVKLLVQHRHLLDFKHYLLIGRKAVNIIVELFVRIELSFPF